jgi:hypothetical protein
MLKKVNELNGWQDFPFSLLNENPWFFFIVVKNDELEDALQWCRSEIGATVGELMINCFLL